MKPRYHSHLALVDRAKHVHSGRHNYLRLDGNELAPHLDTEIWQKIMAQITPHHFSAYPEMSDCYHVLSKYLQLPNENLLIANGSETAIRQIFEIFCGADSSDEVLMLLPSYGMYEVYARIYNAKPEIVQYNANFQLDLDEVTQRISKHTKLVIVANPNGAFGKFHPEVEISAIVEKAAEYGAAVLLDEAYHDFRPESPWPARAIESENLIVVRTLSKAGGLAGLRYGYIISNSEIISILARSKPIYELNSIAALAGNYLLQNPNLIQKSVKEIASKRDWLALELTKLDFDVLYGHTNFVLVRTNEKTEEIKSFFSSHGIGVKTHSDPLLRDFIRITIGTGLSAEKVLKIFQELSNEL